MEGFEMTESQVVNGWIGQGEARGELRTQRQNLLDVLEGRFPGAAPSEVVKLIQQQESFALLQDWFQEAARATSFEHFMAVLER